jgi:PHS family inorganic phosphate transporter-like MFS transporter
VTSDSNLQTKEIRNSMLLTMDNVGPRVGQRTLSYHTVCFLVTYHRLATMMSNTVSYGTPEGEQYSVPLTPSSIEGDYGWPSSGSSTTAASSECDNLLETFADSENVKHTRIDSLFEVLGFQSNPISLRTKAGARNNSVADLRLSMLSNFSTAYNIISISLSLDILKDLYPVTPEASSLCDSALIAGMIVGQLVGGALGDIIGRHRAMSVVMFLQVISAFASACSVEMRIPFLDQHLSIVNVLAIWRFLLGFGCGGVYPLAATLTAESSKSNEDRAKTVALTFSFQGLGYLAVPVVAWIIATILRNSDFSWRLILGFGSVPGAVLISLRLRRMYSYQQWRLSTNENDSIPAQQGQHVEIAKLDATTRVVPVSILDAIMMEKNLVKKMLGTGGCWLLFDILFYGNTLFQPVVLSAAFGAAETVQKTARDTAIIAALALPGYFVSVFAVGRQSPRFIQSQGFLVMGILYLCVGIFFDELAGMRLTLLAVYGSTFFFANYGPNVTTYLLPSMTFSKGCRSTLNGVCAACGKVGALIGTMIFARAALHFGEEVVFLACAVVSFVGCIITLLCVSAQVGSNVSEEVDLRKVQRPISVERLDTVPMKVVISSPSLFDYRADP